MRTLMLPLAFCAAISLSGCKPTVVESTAPLTSEHHGGILFPLTDKQCYVELLNGKREKKGKDYQSNLVAYLLQPDLKTAFSETPTAVKVKIATPKGESTVALKAEADSSDPLGSRRYVSAPGPFELAQTGGEVTVQVGEKTLSGTFRGPR